MTKFMFFLPLAIAAHVAIAQTAAPTGIDAERNLADIASGNGANMVRTYDNRYEGIKGTPFFHEEWSKAVITNNNTLYQNVDVKYNVYENLIVYRSTDGKELILDPSKVDSFVLTDSKTKQEYNFMKFPALAAQDAKLANAFVVALHNGERTQLVMVPEKSLVKADFQGAYSSGKNYDELVDAQSFYFIGPDKKASKVKLNKKNLLKALPDKQEKVQAYISSENINTNSGTGWSKALAYFESLQ